jgi:hypothetical protein
MHLYRLLGGVLASDLAFPELSAAPPDAPPTWRFARASGQPPAAGASARADILSAALTVSIEERTGGAVSLRYTDTGTFEVSGDGGTIRWWPPADDARIEDVRIDLLGRVLAVALQNDGVLPLHGSAAALEAGVVAFIAPKHHGKSTTALALVDAGAKFVSDDMVAVRPGCPPMVLPGAPSARLWPSTVDSLAVARSGHLTPDGHKVSLAALPEATILTDERPLLACYIPRPTDRWEIDRIPLNGIEAALALAGHAKIGGLSGGRRAADLLDLAASVAAAVPVYRLGVPRGLERLPDLVRALLDWHRGGSA